MKETESSLSQSSQVAESENKSVPLTRRAMKSYTDRKGVYHEGIEDELARIESEISEAVNQGVNQDVLESQQEASARPRVNDLRKQAAKLRAEIARRNQKKEKNIMIQSTNLQRESRTVPHVSMERVRQLGEERLRAYKMRLKLSPQTPEQRQAQIDKARQIAAEARRLSGE